MLLIKKPEDRKKGCYTIPAAFFLMALTISCSVNKNEEAIRLGIMPDVDSLPFLVSEKEGLFNKHGVNVELVSFSSAQERDAAFQAGRIDGAISDLLAAVLLSAGAYDIKITSVTDGRYGIATAPGANIASIKELEGKKVGLSNNTIIQYSVDYITKKAGLEANLYIPIAIPKMPIRMEMLLSGQIDAAGLPEPFLSLAKARGANILATSREYDLDAAVVVFNKKYLDKNISKVKKLYAAYSEAAEKINFSSSSYRSFLVSNAAFPEDAARAFEFVKYRKPVLPSLEQVDAVIAWLGAKGLLDKAMPAGSLLDDRLTHK